MISLFNLFENVFSHFLNFYLSAFIDKRENRKEFKNYFIVRTLLTQTKFIHD